MHCNAGGGGANGAGQRGEPVSLPQCLRFWPLSLCHTIGNSLQQAPIAEGEEPPVIAKHDVIQHPNA
jgi:hypothetical protein